ncbi:hypothetical protein BH10BAC3_BH10BAC3_25480 [soil metagenome]
MIFFRYIFITAKKRKVFRKENTKEIFLSALCASFLCIHFAVKTPPKQHPTIKAQYSFTAQHSPDSSGSPDEGGLQRMAGD